MRGLFVTATDTGVGKSVVSCCLIAAIRAAGIPVAAYKPALTGTDEPPEGPWPTDDVMLASASGEQPEHVAPLRFAPAVSPHLAAELATTEIDPGQLLAGARERAPGGDGALVVEGVGGLLVPLRGDYLVRDLATQLGLPLVLVARPGLGTINHTLLTLESARSAGLEVLAVVMTPWPVSPGAMERSNLETVAELGAIEVLPLEELAGPDPAALAAAGEMLPWRTWLDV